MLLKISFLFAFLTIQVSCEENGSLAFIIDDKASSVNRIQDIKSAVKMIYDTALAQTSFQIEDVAVVTFNDPDVTFRTRTYNKRVFRKTLDSIVAGGGADCPKMSLSGIKKGLEETLPGSYLFVFTDASAKDYDKFEEVKALCQQKKSQITFILTGTCRDSNPQMNEVYDDIAMACGGAVIRTPYYRSLHMYMYVREYMDVARNMMASHILSPFQWTEVTFTKDKSTDYILATAWGTDVQLQVRNQDGEVENAIGRNDFKILKLADLPNGPVTVKARSAAKGHLAVYGHIPITDSD